MRWIIFIAFYLLINLYAFQAVRTVSKSFWLTVPYLLVSVLILANFLYQWNQPNPSGGFTGGRGYSLGFVLAFIAGNIILTIFMFGEDINRFLIYLKNPPALQVVMF
jgi:hypothetical protein